MGFEKADKVGDMLTVGIGEEKGIRGKIGRGSRFSEDIVFY